MIEYGRLMLRGRNFTEYSKIICGDTVLETVYIDPTRIAAVVETELTAGEICVAQVNGEGKELGRTDSFAIETKLAGKSA